MDCAAFRSTNVINANSDKPNGVAIAVLGTSDSSTIESGEMLVENQQLKKRSFYTKFATRLACMEQGIDRVPLYFSAHDNFNHEPTAVNTQTQRHTCQLGNSRDRPSSN